MNDSWKDANEETCCIASLKDTIHILTLHPNNISNDKNSLSDHK